MKTLTEIAVRLRVISTSMLAILGFISLGLVLGFWAGSRGSPSGRESETRASASALPGQQWCDPGHTVPFIPASECGGDSSCERAGFPLLPDERARINWPALCRKFQ